MRKNQFDRLRGGFTMEEHISGFGDFFQAAVLVPLVLLDGQYHLLFEKRAAGIRQGGEVCFPGGAVDSGDTGPLKTALRETQEEIGCPPERVDFVGRLDTLYLPTGSLVHAFLGVLNQPLENMVLETAEVDSVFTVPLSFFMENTPEQYHCKVLVHPYQIDPVTGEKEVYLPVEELGLPDFYREPWGRGNHKVYLYRTSPEPIWGLTARIISDMAEKLKQLEQSPNQGPKGQ